jgi:RNA polymerase sigma-70 factor (ECF subfamily)
MGLWLTAEARPSPFEEAAAGELEDRVERALAAMPPSYREVLLLSLEAEMTPAEMAIVCGVTPEALRQRLLRARAMLKQELKFAAVRPKNPALREVIV